MKVEEGALLAALGEQAFATLLQAGDHKNMAEEIQDALGIDADEWMEVTTRTLEAACMTVGKDHPGDMERAVSGLASEGGAQLMFFLERIFFEMGLNIGERRGREASAND